MALKEMINVDAMNNTTKYYLGEQDAAKEWNDNKSIAKRYFLPTAAYESFCQPSSLILLGRTGTGKTAILRRLEQDINDGSITGYQRPVRIQFQEILKCIPNFYSLTTTQKTYEELVDAIEMIINLRVMKKAYDTMASSAPLKSKLCSYLEKKGIHSDKKVSIIRKISKAIQVSAGFDGKPGQIAANLSLLGTVLSSFCDDEYSELMEELYEYLADAPLLVLVDTMDEYDVNDARLIIVVKAFISACFRYYTEVSYKHILMKVSLPSEIYTKIVQTLPGKQQGNTTVIQWGFKDLLCFIALRMKWWRDRNPEESTLFSYLDEYDVEDLAKSPSMASEVLNVILPLTCPTSLTFRLETLAYIMRHTTKKPRELMTLINAIIHRILQENDIQYFRCNEDKIREEIHSRQEELVLSALSMYETSYPQIGTYIEELLVNQEMRFAEIPSNRIKEVNAKLKSDSLMYDSSDIIRILIESGILGKVNKKSEIKPDNQMLRNAESITVITAVFEYQIKGRLNFTSRDEYIIHPMCYEHFSCFVDDHTLVYPEKSDNDGDEVYMQLVKSVE